MKKYAWSRAGQIRLVILGLFALAQLSGCGSSGASRSDPGAPATNSGGSAPTASAAYPVAIRAVPPSGATQVRVSGADDEGETVLTAVLVAETNLTLDVPPSVSTLMLEYLDATGHELARFAESASNLQEGDFRQGLIDPPLVLVPGRDTSSKEGDDPNPVVGPDVKFSFAFFGCNRASEASTTDNREGFRDQLNSSERASTANVAQLRQIFEDIKSLSPRPSFIVICGDVVEKPKTDSVSDAATALGTELANWTKIRASGLTVVDRSGARVSVPSPGEASLFAIGALGVKVVVLPGNHEMLYRKVADKQEIPHRASGQLFTSHMGGFIWGDNGPQQGVDYGDGGLPTKFPKEEAQRDESQLSYTFRATAGGQVDPAGESLFMVLNTDTYVGDTAGPGRTNIGHIPLRWIRAQLSQAQKDPTVKQIFVFGHRPIQPIFSEAGIDPEHPDVAETFYRLLNNPTATTTDELKVPDPNTKVRGYFCAHAHLFSTKQPPGDRAVQQIVSGSGGSEPDPTNNPTVKPFPWFGFGVVAVRQDNAVDMGFFGRNVHPSAHTPTGFWWEQEPVKLRGANISGPGAALPKIPKAIRRLYPFASQTSARYAQTFEDTFQDTSRWQKEAFKDVAGSPVEYMPENVVLEPGGGLRLKVTAGHFSSSQGKWFAHSGRVRSNFTQKYGLFMFRAHVPRGAHLWPALWTIGQWQPGEENKWPKTGEIDVMETVDPINRRPDFTSRLMVRTSQFPAGQYFASLPADDSSEIKTVLTEAQWAQPHTFAVDWYEVRNGTELSDVRFDFYLDPVVNSDGTLGSAADPSKPPAKLHSYSLKSLVESNNSRFTPCPDWKTLNSEWSAQSLILNVAVGGAWDPKLKDVTSGAWQPPTDGSADMVVDWVRCYQRI